MCRRIQSKTSRPYEVVVNGADGEQGRDWRPADLQLLTIGTVRQDHHLRMDTTVAWYWKHRQRAGASSDMTQNILTDNGTNSS